MSSELEDDGFLSKVLEVKISIDGDDKIIDLLKMLAIADEDLSENVIQLPTQIAFIGSLAAEAKRRCDIIKQQFDVWSAHEDEKCRGRLIKVTEKQVEKMIERDPEYTRFLKDLATAEYQHRILQNATRSLEAKMAMLQTHASNLRAELYEVIVKKRIEKREELLERKRRIKEKIRAKNKGL